MTTTSGMFVALDLAAGVDTPAFAGVASATITCDIHLCDRNDDGAAAHVHVFRGTGANPAPATDSLYFNQKYVGYADIEPIVLAPGQKLWVRSDRASVTCQVQGFVEPTYAV